VNSRTDTGNIISQVKSKTGSGDIKSNVGVSFVVPVRNEEQHIQACLQSLVNQDYPARDCEIIVVDGRSSDRTREMVAEFCRKYANVCCLDNPAGIVPTAMNVGIRAARGQIIIRADGHNVYPPEYAANCVKYLEKTGADNVGGPWITVPADDSLGAKLVAAILSSPFGVGNSKFRTGQTEGFVDTVPFGAFRREVFDRLGMYNENLVRNQDNELNARIRKAGGKIYLTAALTTYYHPVKNLRQLLRYAFKTSQWHIYTLVLKRSSMSFRHMAAGAFLVLLLLLLAGSLRSRFAVLTLMGTAAVYFLVGYYFSFRATRGEGPAMALVFPFAVFCFQMAYGAGTIVGLRHLFQQPSLRPIRPGLRVEERAKGHSAGKQV
jgi:glycosyltransferase involved in cell wall biosynthesis